MLHMFTEVQTDKDNKTGAPLSHQQPVLICGRVMDDDAMAHTGQNPATVLYGQRLFLNLLDSEKVKGFGKLGDYCKPDKEKRNPVARSEVLKAFNERFQNTERLEGCKMVPPKIARL
jgi:hypothetical protein